MTDTLDLATLDPQEAAGALSRWLDAAADGAGVELAGCDPHAPLLAPLLKAHPGRVAWFPLFPPVGKVLLLRLPPNQGIGGLMGGDHKRCDALFADMENAAHAGDASRATGMFQRFDTGMRHHFTMEEKGFFPLFERATGMTQGPTAVMRMEHRQMLGLLERMAESVRRGDMAELANTGGTLLFLMQQHNAKEEQMLYPMGDMHLARDRASVLGSMAECAL
ncbi:MAG: hemerythrin domain-containing protein [Magnetococcus sp. WYHC-3]